MEIDFSQKYIPNVENKSLITLFTIKDLSAMLGVSPRTILTYIHDNRIKAIKLGGKWVVSEDNLLKFLRGD